MTTNKHIQSAVEEFKKQNRVHPVLDRYAIMILDLAMPDNFYEWLTKTLTTLANTIHEESINNAEENKYLCERKYLHISDDCNGCIYERTRNRALQDIINYHKEQLNK